MAMAKQASLHSIGVELEWPIEKITVDIEKDGARKLSPSARHKRRRQFLRVYN